MAQFASERSLSGIEDFNSVVDAFLQSKSPETLRRAEDKI